VRVNASYISSTPAEPTTADRAVRDTWFDCRLKFLVIISCCNYCTVRKRKLWLDTSATRRRMFVHFWPFGMSGTLESLFRIALLPRTARRSADSVILACRLIIPLVLQWSIRYKYCVCVCVCVCVCIFLFRLTFPGRPGWRNGYSDSLRVGRSGVRTPMGARFSLPFHTGNEDHPASSTVGAGSLSRGPGLGVIHSAPSSASVKERVELYFYSPSGPSWCLIGNTFAFIVFSCLGMGHATCQSVRCRQNM
jgi:hypothetical protein